MPDLLLELFSEEIPARMQGKAAEDLKGLITGGLVNAGLSYEGAAAYVTPRRLALTVHGLNPRSADVREEKKGPRVTAPEPAIQGFLKGAGLASLGEARIVEDKKGDYYVADIVRPGRATTDILKSLVPEVVKTFPWPKSQRWGSGSLRWVRPLHSILCTFGPETEEPEVVEIALEGISSGNVTYGHRFHAPQEIRVRRFADYLPALEKAFVVLDPARRREIILHDARDLALAHGLELVEDDGLVGEVAGLVEWPVVLIGTFDAAFLDVPDEVIRATIRANQKCFVLKDPATGRLANRFILTANRVATDGGRTIVAGNERVIRARLSDARFFWQQDLAETLESRLPRLDLITFHEKLGSQGERVARLEALARVLAPLVDADPGLAARAARLAKADLVTGMVGEFPELQGLMGRHYALRHGEPAAVAVAIEEHYKPQGPGDRVPSDPVSIAVALADKLDILAGFWSINEKPTGSKDPFALRRAALGVIRIILDNGLKLHLKELIAASAFAKGGADHAADLLGFFADRLKVQLRDQGARHDLVDAVLALGEEDDFVSVVARVEALGRFLATDDGKSLLAGYTRAANILKAEEKKGAAVENAVAPALFTEEAEKALFAAIGTARHAAGEAAAREDFTAAMAALAPLRQPVDAFFADVLVNADDASVRANRLALLAEIRHAVHRVADFSRIGG